LVEVVDMERLLAHCSEEESVLVGLDEEATTPRRQMTREEEIALDGVEESSSEEKISTLPERALSCLTRDCVFATIAMVGLCVMVSVALANNHALTVARLSVLIMAVTLTIFCCVLSNLTKN
jgi:hypothetical protein